MLYREVPKTGDKLSALGYGCMRFPKRMQSIDEKRAERQILHAMERGVNYYDTAYPYHGGKSEPFLGRVLSENGCRDRVKLATKLPHWMTASKEEMERMLDEQLAKLRTDRIDYYLIHALNGDPRSSGGRGGRYGGLDDQALDLAGQANDEGREARIVGPSGGLRMTGFPATIPPGTRVI